MADTNAPSSDNDSFDSASNGPPNTPVVRDSRGRFKKQEPAEPLAGGAHAPVTQQPITIKDEPQEQAQPLPSWEQAPGDTAQPPPNYRLVTRGDLDDLLALQSESPAPPAR